ncbi:MAG: 3-phosphoshikimate 1-carboxyvinyltransferase [Verrucomicrobiales bacterium]
MRDPEDLLKFPLDSMSVSSFQVQATGPWRGTLRVPGDKSISHRAAILGGLARGSTKVTGFLPSDDCLCTLAAMRAMGAKVEFPAGEDPERPTRLVITGTGGQLAAPATDIDCGNSGTAMRLLAGVLAAQSFSSRMTGDASLSSRPMGRIIRPLGEMGARLAGQGEKQTAPLAITGGKLSPIRYEMPVASAQVKSAILLAGLFTDGTTTVVQPETTRDHTERLFRHFGLHLAIKGNCIEVTGPQTPVARDLHVPGDISSAAFWCVAAATIPGSDLTIGGVGLNPTRTGILDVLERMGASVEREVTGGEDGEPYGNLRIRGGKLRGTTIAGKEIPNVIDEIPVLAVAASLADGATEIRDAAELRVKESDRISEVVRRLQSMGAKVEEYPDGLRVEGPNKLHAARIESHGDHRIAMAFAIAGLSATGVTDIVDTACIATSYPGFESTLRSLLA